MKRIVLMVLAMVMMSTPIFAAPFLVCDPQTGVTYYTITGDPYWIANVTAQADGSLRTDLATIPTGVHNISVVACNIWGCSSIVPFSFTKALPVIPASIRVAP